MYSSDGVSAGVVYDREAPAAEATVSYCLGGGDGQGSKGSEG